MVFILTFEKPEFVSLREISIYKAINQRTNTNRDISLAFIIFSIYSIYHIVPKKPNLLLLINKVQYNTNYAKCIDTDEFYKCYT